MPIYSCTVQHNRTTYLLHINTPCASPTKHSLRFYLIFILTQCFSPSLHFCYFVQLNSKTVLFNKFCHFILLIKRYNSCRVLPFSTIFFHSRRSWASSDHLVIFIFLKSYLTSSHLFFVFPLVELQAAAIYIFSLQHWFQAFCVYGQTNSFVCI